jgi:hypothetical protein
MLDSVCYEINLERKKFDRDYVILLQLLQYELEIQFQMTLDKNIVQNKKTKEVREGNKFRKKRQGIKSPINKEVIARQVADKATSDMLRNC